MTDFQLDTPMREVETRYPFSRSVLHAKFHVGGCVTCGYEPEETISQVATKHGKDAEAMLAALNEGLESLQSAEISGQELALLRTSGLPVLLIDVREPWEHEIVNLGPEALLLTALNMETVFARAAQTPHVVVYCHHGIRSLNAVLYMRENGIKHARSLHGGVDLFGREIDTTLARY